MRLTVELHKALFGKDKIKLNQWELEFLTKLWVSYLNVGKFDKVTYKQKEVLKKRFFIKLLKLIRKTTNMSRQENILKKVSILILIMPRHFINLV